MAEGLQEVTAFSHTSIEQGQALLPDFTNISHDVFPKALKAVLDVSTGMREDLTVAAREVGRALNDPTKGLMLLSRAGIMFSNAQKQLIADLMATGDRAKAQSIVLDELEKRFGGSAEAARNTLGGALSALKSSFEDLIEKTGDNGISGGLTRATNELAKFIDTAARGTGSHSGAAAVGDTIEGLTHTTIGLLDVLGRVGSWADAHPYLAGALGLGVGAASMATGVGEGAGLMALLFGGGTLAGALGGARRHARWSGHSQPPARAGRNLGQGRPGSN